MCDSGGVRLQCVPREGGVGGLLSLSMSFMVVDGSGCQSAPVATALVASVLVCSVCVTVTVAVTARGVTPWVLGRQLPPPPPPKGPPGNNWLSKVPA